MSHEKMIASDMRIVKELVFRTVDAIVSNPRCRRVIGGARRCVPIVVAIEACSGDAMYIGPMFIEAIQPHGECCLLSEIRNKDIGVYKNEDITKRMIAATQAILATNSVCIADDCQSISSSFACPPLTIAQQRSELAKQFISFRADPKSGRFTGKDSSGSQDDLIITFMMNIYWSQYFNLSEREDYAFFKKRYGSRLWGMNIPEAFASKIGLPLPTKRRCC